MTSTRRWAWILGLLVVLSVSSVDVADLRSAPVPQQPDVMAEFAATAANVSHAGADVRIVLFRWSTDDEREAVHASLDPLPPPPPPPPDGGRGGRGGRGGFGRGRGGGEPEPADDPDPMVRLAAALNDAPTVGYIWTDEVVGYSIKYAHQIRTPDGNERIVLATNRRLGSYTRSWDLESAAPVDLAFTVVDIELASNGTGEGRSSLTTGVLVDDEDATLALENASAAPVILESVRRTNG